MSPSWPTQAPGSSPDKPTSVAKLREQLGLLQCRAGQLLRGGLRAFQKSESGKRAVPVPMSHLLTLLMNDPKRLKEIASAASGEAKGSAKKRSVRASPYRRRPDPFGQPRLLGQGSAQERRRDLLESLPGPGQTDLRDRVPEADAVSWLV